MNSDASELDMERDERHHQLYTRKGFDPDDEIHEFFGCFSYEDAKRSLFESTRTHVIPVYLTSEREGVNLPVVLDLARPLYLAEDIGDDIVPNWYFEGWILKTGFDTTQGFDRVRIHISAMDAQEFREDDIFLWQRIKKPTETVLPIDASILKLNLNGRTYTVFGGRGLETIEDVLEFAKRYDFSEIRGFGPGLLADLKEKLSQAGYDVENFSFRRW